MSDDEILVSTAEFDDLLAAKKIVVSKVDLVDLLAEKDSLRYEVERLRLTDAEQSLIRRLAAECEDSHPRAWTNRALTADDRATLRGLLERTK